MVLRQLLLARNADWPVTLQEISTMLAIRLILASQHWISSRISIWMELKMVLLKRASWANIFEMRLTSHFLLRKAINIELWNNSLHMLSSPLWLNLFFIKTIKVDIWALDHTPLMVVMREQTASCTSFIKKAVSKRILLHTTSPSIQMPPLAVNPTCNLVTSLIMWNNDWLGLQLRIGTTSNHLFHCPILGRVIASCSHSLNSIQQLSSIQKLTTCTSTNLNLTILSNPSWRIFTVTLTALRIIVPGISLVIWYKNKEQAFTSPLAQMSNTMLKFTQI